MQQSSVSQVISIKTFHDHHLPFSYVHCAECSLLVRGVPPPVDDPTMATLTGRAFRGRIGASIRTGQVSGRSIQTFYPGTVVLYSEKAGDWDLEGNLTLECLPTGEWSAPNPFPLPTCNKYCTMLPPISNGYCSWDAGQNKVEWRNRIDCTCNSGYRFKKYRKATCRDADTWVNLPECVPIQDVTTTEPKCRRIPRINYGVCVPMFNYSVPFSPGETVRCTCDPGYALKAREPTGCQISVLQMKIPFSTNCRAISGSDLETNEIIPGGVAQCDCMEGFQMNADDKSVSCQGDGVWSENLPTCSPIFMGRNDRIRGSRGGRMKTYAELVEIYNRQVIEFNGLPDPIHDGIATCNSPRFVNVPMCVKIPVVPTKVYCEPPREVPYAGCMDCEGQNKTDWIPGDTLKFNCHPGFHIVGNPRITCQLNGLWSQYPRCVPDDPTDPEPTCGEVPYVVDGYCQAETTGEDGRFVAGTEAECFCSLDALFGYEMKGDPFVFCKRNGNWTEAPTCTEIVVTTTPAPECPLIELMSLVEVNTMTCESSAGDGASVMRPGESATCTCHAGYANVFGINEVQCTRGTGTGSWSTNIPYCEPELDPATCFLSQLNANITNGYCEQMDSDTEGVVINNRENFEVGDTVECKCNSGYTISDSRVTCEGHDYWSATPYCRQDATTPRGYDCPAPSASTYTCPDNAGGHLAGEVFSCSCTSNPSAHVELRCRRSGLYYVSGGSC